MPQLIGGPLDGREIRKGSFRYLIPECRLLKATWFEEDEPVFAEIDSMTGLPRMARKSEIVNHVYELGRDGNYHYKGY